VAYLIVHRANIDANNALNGNMTAKEGEKYTKRADETRLLIDELEEKKEEPTEADLKNIEDLKAKGSAKLTVCNEHRYFISLKSISIL
jgi:hypothetical protein